MFRNENIPTLPKGIFSFNACSLVQQYIAGYCDVDLQSSYFKAKSLEQCGFGSKHGFELNFFFSIFLEFSKIKIDKAGVKLQTMWQCKYSGILEFNVKFDETYMKMSKYENNTFPYPVHSTVNLPA